MASLEYGQPGGPAGLMGCPPRIAGRSESGIVISLESTQSAHSERLATDLVDLSGSKLPRDSVSGLLCRDETSSVNRPTVADSRGSLREPTSGGTATSSRTPESSEIGWKSLNSHEFSYDYRYPPSNASKLRSLPTLRSTRKTNIFAVSKGS